MSSNRDDDARIYDWSGYSEPINAERDFEDIYCLECHTELSSRGGFVPSITMMGVYCSAECFTKAGEDADDLTKIRAKEVQEAVRNKRLMPVGVPKPRSEKKEGAD